MFELWEPVTLKAAQVRHVARMVKFHSGNKTRIARDLGIDRRSLSKIMKE